MIASRRRHCVALVLCGLLACGGALAQTDWRGLLHSSKAADREAALLQLGDAGLADPADLQAAADLLSDPAAAVRWNAIAALRKAGPAATPVLLGRLADGGISPHVGSYFNGCGRSLFVPSVGEVAAATLAAAPDSDAELLWRRFVDGDVDDGVARLLSATLAKGRYPPPTDVVRTSHRQRAAARDLVFDLADVKDPRTIEAVAASIEAAGTDRTEDFDTAVAQLLARAGTAGSGAARKGLASSPFPERWLAAFASVDGADDVALQAFNSAAASGRSAARAALARALAELRLQGGGPQPKAPAWLGQVAPAAMRAFLSQPVGPGSVDLEWVAAAAQRVALVKAWRPDVIDFMARTMASGTDHGPADRVAGELGALATQLSAVMDEAERQQAWRAVRAALRTSEAPAARLAAVVAGLPPPRAADRGALAPLLVRAVLDGRLAPTVLRRPGAGAFGEASTPPSADARAWHAALRAAVPPSAPGREPMRARLLAELGADAPVVQQAWRAVETSPRATAAESAEALGQLAARPSTRAWAVARLKQRLLQSTDPVAASHYVRALWGPTLDPGSMSFDPEERRSRATSLDGVWAQISELPTASPARAAAIRALFQGSKHDLPPDVWLTRAVTVVGTSDAATDTAVLAYLADEAPDVSAQTLPCDIHWMYSDGAPRRASLDPGLREQLASALRAPLAAGGPGADLALRVWRGFGLPSNSDIEARVLQAEAAKASACPLAGSRATMADLAATLSLRPDDADRAVRFAQLLDARSSMVACGAVAAIGDMGADAIPGAASMLRYWLGGAADGPRRMVPERATCGRDEPFAAAFAKGLAKLSPAQRSSVLDRALAADLPRSRPADTRPPLGRAEHAKPGWAPWPDEADAWSMEHGRRPDTARPLPPALVTALDEVGDAGLLTRLRSSPPGPGWVLLAESQWLRQEPGPRRRDLSAPEAQPPPHPRARIVLAALAPHWPALEAAQRARLLPLLAVGDARDPAVRAMIDRSLDNPGAGERAAALRVARSLWPGDPRLPALERADLVARSLATRLEPMLNDVFDSLRPPAMICTSGGGYATLPAFPWPPPEGYRPPEPLKLEWFGPPGTTAGAWFQRVREALHALSADYETGLFSGPPGGFALVARLERIEADGKPFPGRARWTTEGRPKLNLSELLGDLFLEQPGRFRIVVFVVTDQPNFQPAPGAKLPNVREGAATMPPELAAMPMDGKSVLALVYSFERRPGEPMRAWVEGSPSTLQHLVASGIWKRLNPQ
ncbi:hypothetical protein GCM10023165_47750 [Variovorax defluvii]|uniref:HEAT repeat protein n=1 Tax=Variovorax defluvii TaxID=913761 RepID=A0ABP8IBL2_9BURK